jgi:FkbM family methyltransferase
MQLTKKMASLLPDRSLHRGAAWAFRLRAEQRLLFLDDLVPRGRDAADVGAWWGPWTYWLSRRCPRVWAFEPNPRLAMALRAVARPNVQVEEVALSDRTATDRLYVPRLPGPDAQATLESEHRLADVNQVDVALRRLDDYELADLGFLKIDVEAHEAAVLAGSLETIRRCRPIVLIEIEQRFHDRPITQFFEWFEREGYSGWMRQERRWESTAHFDVRRHQLDHADNVKSIQYVNNFVFTPTSSPPGGRPV